MLPVPHEQVQLDNRFSQENNRGVVFIAPSDKKEIASLGALANAAYALTAFMAAGLNLGAFSGDGSVLLAVALANGGLTQFICGNIFGGTAFSSFGAYWISYFVYFLLLTPNLDANTRRWGEGYFNIAWFIFTLYMTVASFKLDIPTFALFATLDLTYLFLSLGTFLRTIVLIRLAGATGIISSLCGFYLSAKDVLYATFKPEGKKQA